ncbi:MAG: D-Ala-D-Ala carboxypeptidase family metallohydrolase [Aminipila sp.]
MNLQNEQLTEHFKLSEFACNGKMIITPNFIKFIYEVIEPFRKWYKRPININSGYRTRDKNIAVGGVGNSLHLKAMAIDFSFPVEFRSMSHERKQQFLNNINQKWYSLCTKAGGYGQICWYDTYIHLGLSYRRQYFEDKRGKR